MATSWSTLLLLWKRKLTFYKNYDIIIIESKKDYESLKYLAFIILFLFIREKELDIYDTSYV